MDDLRYLAKLADWAVGQGFCQIEGLDDPDEWCFQFWSKYGPEDGSGYSPDALADRVVEVAIAAQAAEIARLRAGQVEMVATIGRLAHEAGKAKGRLEGSEMPGIVDGWRDNCEGLKRDNARLKAQAEKLDQALAEIIARWDSPKWKDVEPTADVINRARAALADYRGK